MKKAVAFCPGHVTGFFEICRSEDVLSTGSRGAGLCLTLGARTEVKVSDAPRQSMTVLINGRTSSAPVTKLAVRNLICDSELKVSVRTTLDLPVGQGFGMSAAGSISATFALAEITGASRQRAFEAAHIAEVEGGGGLGDVSALTRGGITIRTRAGLPTKGKVVRIDGEPEVVLCVIGRSMSTKNVLTNKIKADAINRSGSRKVDQLLKAPSIYRLMELSSRFSRETGLASKKIIAAMDAASESGLASMSMLGNSIFAIGDTQGLATILSEFGETYVCRVDTIGPRLL